MDKLLHDVQYLKGVGPRRSRLLTKMGINTFFDLLWYFPRTYFNRDNIQALDQLVHGEQASLVGTVKLIRTSRSRKGMSIFTAVLAIQGGLIEAVWFNQPFVAETVKIGQGLWLSGKVKNAWPNAQIHVSEYEVLENEDSTLGIVPVYTITNGITQKIMRSLLAQVLEKCLDEYPEILSAMQQEQYGLCSIKQAFCHIHFPADRTSYQLARQRLAFEELLLFQWRLQLMGQERIIPGIMHLEKNHLVEEVTSSLPFKLTAAQRKVIQEIFADMELPQPMNRLLQGDVGAGKTVVAALAMAKAAASGYQSVIMAPTEILAHQHFQSLSSIFAGHNIRLGELTGSTPPSEKKTVCEDIAQGNIDLVIGTHALIQEPVSFKSLGLVVIDEQHRFGVRQRAALAAKGNNPDVLVMTATPIPRTLALTAYGNLNISIIDTLPPGRQPIKTKYIPAQQRWQAYEFVIDQLEKGRQGYIVCPLVEESEKQDLQAAIKLYEELRQGHLQKYGLGMLHGRMRPGEKEEIMQQFKQGQIKVLITTTVVEVGVDVSAAAFMVIEHAERFGLSQLHQLRGRVGRGSFQSYCILLADPGTIESRQRLQAMEKSNDGFYLAQQDLLIRGPGEFWGVRQHGLDQLKIANLTKDLPLIEKARQCSRENDPSPWQQYIHARYPTTDNTSMN